MYGSFFYVLNCYFSEILRPLIYCIFLSQIEVAEAREVELGAQWDFSSEEDKDDDSGESIYETEEDD